MSATVRGVGRLRRKNRRLIEDIEREIAKANAKSAGELARTARILHPGDGKTRAQIEARDNGDGSWTVDFGDKAKVTEGTRGPRPYVNPAMKALEKRFRGRYRRAVNKAVRRLFNG